MNKKTNRRNFVRQALVSTAFSPLIGSSLFEDHIASPYPNIQALSDMDKGKDSAKGIRITGTFLDEISHDIPHQNWGEKEWDADFRHMRHIGIDTVIMIRSGYRKFITYPSSYLIRI